MNGYENIKKHIDDYVYNFLYEEGEKYYYIKETDTFIEYKTIMIIKLLMRIIFGSNI